MIRYIIMISILTMTLFAKTVSEEKKMTLLYLEMDYCPWCKKMDREVFEDNSKLERLKKLYDIKRLKKADPKIPPFIKTKFYPTTYILSSDGNKIIDELPGYMKAEDYMEYLETLYDIENN